MLISQMFCFDAHSALAEAASLSSAKDIGIIVLPTIEQAQGILKQLQAGTDFSILAKEKSIDATAIDGGYMGKLDPAQLRAELREAVASRQTGELSDIVRLPSGYAILKILAAPPPIEDLNGKRINALMASSAIRFGPAISGLSEADAVFTDYPKPDGWERDMQKVCEIRKASVARAEDYIQSVLQSPPAPDPERTFTPITAHSALAQLYAFDGNMLKSIDHWKSAYQISEVSDPGHLPNLLESIGVSYLHYAEMQNGAYRDSRDIDIFPPLHPSESYAYKDESKLAIQYFQKYLEQRPDDLEVRWLLNLAYMTLGEYPTGVPAAYRISESNFHSSESIGRFVDVAPATHLNVVRQAGGVIVDDFDNDGLLDLVVSSDAQCEPLRYFHNDGDGTFSDRSEQAGILNQLGGLNIVQADYNNDGCMDILILRGGWEFAERKSLLRNNCNGTFTDVTDASGLNVTVTSTQAAVWADYDNDGFLDLFLGNESSPTQLFHNKGDGTFEEIGARAGIDQTAFTKGVAAADYDHDGFVDFYVANRNGANFLYHNNGDGTFTELGRQAGVQAPSYSFATWFFDYDNDGWPDIFVNSYVPAVEESVKTFVGVPNNAETTKLYRNKHDGTFEDVSAKVGLDKVYMPMGANFGDLDNDGFLDVYLGAGQPSFTALLPHVLLRNCEGKSFVDITESSGTGELHKGHGIVFADLSRQGHEDLIAQIGGTVPSDSHAMRVFQNPGNNNDWLNLHLVGVKTNRAAVGAEIRVTVHDGKAPPRSIYRTVGATSSFGGNPMEQNIGLGPNAHIVALDITWPASGTQQHFTGIAKNQYLEIKELSTSYSRLERHPFRLGGAGGAPSIMTAQKSK